MARFGGGKAFGGSHFDDGSGGNTELIADAGADQSQSSLGVVTLDGSGCSGHDSLSWVLTRYDRNEDSSDQSGILSDSTATSPTFTPQDYGYRYVATVSVVQSGKTDRSDSAVVQITAHQSLHWDDATKVDPNSLENGSTVLGETTATIVSNGTHGDMTHADPLYYHWDIGARPSWARRLVVTATMGASQNANASGGAEEVYLGALTEVPMAANDGQVGGIRQTAGNVWKLIDVVVPGSSTSGGDTIGDPSGETIAVSIPFGNAADEDTMGPATATSKGASASAMDVGSSNATSVPTNVYVFAGFGLGAASPSAGQTWPMGEVTAEWQ